jgi:hypothetical protein
MSWWGWLLVAGAFVLGGLTALGGFLLWFGRSFQRTF